MVERYQVELDEVKYLYANFKTNRTVLTEGYFKTKFQRPLAELNQLAVQIREYYNIFDELSGQTGQAVDIVQSTSIDTNMDQFANLLNEVSLSLTPERFPESQFFSLFSALKGIG